MKILNSIISFIKKHNLISPSSEIVLGLSGGPDSIFLLQLLCHLRDTGALKKVIAAHLDHEWRSDSQEDVAFCEQAAETLNVSFICARLSDFSSKLSRSGSQEDVGRQARRLFLESVMKEQNANDIALAHHLQDQEETFLIRLIRGTSLTGLCAMWPKHGPYIRPLLETNKNEIVQYLDEHAIAYLVDPTNESPSFLRNRIRKSALPALQDCDKRFDSNFLATLTRLQGIESYLAQHTKELLKTITHRKDGDIIIDIHGLLKFPIAMQYRLLMEWLCACQVSFPVSQSFLDEIIRFFKQPESKEHEIHHQWTISKRKGMAALKKR